MATRPTHNLCIGRKVPGKRKPSYTKVGVGWWDPEAEQMMVRINVRLILGPEDENVYLFLDSSSRLRDEPQGDDGPMDEDGHPF
jgi:hypothetical protein